MKISHRQGCKGVHLTRREIEVLLHLGIGENTAQIAEALSISQLTVAHHVATMQSKCLAPNRAALISVAIVGQILSGDEWPLIATGSQCLVGPPTLVATERA